MRTLLVSCCVVVTAISGASLFTSAPNRNRSSRPCGADHDCTLDTSQRPVPKRLPRGPREPVWAGSVATFVGWLLFGWG
jgi:hypothetical protein